MVHGNSFVVSVCVHVVAFVEVNVNALCLWLYTTVVFVLLIFL